MERLLKISEFSALSGISRQLLIYYDNEGILPPKQVDPDNGYRYYSYRQLTSASVIVSLRQAGMSLECIRNYLTERSPEKLITLFREQEHNLEEQIRKLERIKSMVRSRLQHTEQGILIGSEKIWVEDCPEENLFLGPDLPIFSFQMAGTGFRLFINPAWNMASRSASQSARLWNSTHQKQRCPVSP